MVLSNSELSMEAEDLVDATSKSRGRESVDPPSAELKKLPTPIVLMGSDSPAPLTGAGNLQNDA
jgi:hypothetical protein